MSCQNHPRTAPARERFPLDKIDFFARISAPQLTALQNAGRLSLHNKNHVLFTQDDPAEWFYLIETGWVKLFRETLDGNEVILDVLPQGSVFGETTMFEGGIYPYGAEVVEAATITAYPIALLRDAIHSRPELALAMLDHISQKNLLKDRALEHLTVMNAPQRIGCFLLRLCKTPQPAPIVLHLPYDKTLVAARLGMQPETFSRALNRLQADTGIKIRGATVEIDNLNALIKYTCTACSNVFPCDD